MIQLRYGINGTSPPCGRPRRLELKPSEVKKLEKGLSRLAQRGRWRP